MTPSTRKKAEQAGWIFDYSKSLNQEYAHRKTAKGTEIMMSDKVGYSPQEVRVLNRGGVKINPEIHTIKRIFGGEIVEIKRIEEPTIDSEGRRIVPLF